MSKIVTHDPILKTTLVKEQEYTEDSHPDTEEIVIENEFRRLTAASAAEQARQDLKNQLRFNTIEEEQS